MWGLSVLFMQTRAQGSTGRTWFREQEGPLASRTEVYSEQTGWGTNLSPSNPDGGRMMQGHMNQKVVMWHLPSFPPPLCNRWLHLKSNLPFQPFPNRGERAWGGTGRSAWEFPQDITEMLHILIKQRKKIRSWPMGLDYGQFSKIILRYQPWGLQV